MDSPQASQASPRELSRLAALLRYEILDTPDEAEFDDFTHLAARCCGTPISLISLVDEHRQWFKSRVGLDVSETPRNISFCAHTLEGQGIFEINDARLDPRFRDNPLVTGAPHIRFYAATPLTSPDGYNLGTLCVIDRQPRQLSEEQRDTLTRLGRQVIRLFERRLLAHRYAEQAAMRQALLNSSANAVLVVRPDGQIASVNPTAERLLGYREAELLDRPLTDTLFPPAALERRAALLAAEQGKPVEAGFAVLTTPSQEGRREMREWRLRHRDGSEVPLLLSVVAMHDEAELLRGYIVSAYDLTHQEQLQQRLRQITMQVPGMLFQARWQNGEPNALLYVSQAVEAIYGLAPEQAVHNSATLYAAVHEEDRRPLLKSICRAARDVTAWHCEHRVRHPHKGVIWVEARATPLRQTNGALLWYGLVTDISERKAQQLELDKQQEINRRLLDALAEAVVACDADGCLTLFNNTAVNWLGLRLEQLRPEQWREHYPLYLPDGVTLLPLEEGPLMRALKGERVRNMELSMVNNQAQRHLLASADPLFAANGQKIGAVLAMHDITERKRVERLQREFVSTVSHELRTPLTSITGALALICADVMGKVPDPLRELLDIANQNSRRLGALINDLLDMDKLNAGKMRFALSTQPLQPLLEQALRDNQSYAERHNTRYLLHGDTSALVRVDALRLHQVLSNLLSNAAKFTPAGETVEVSIEAGDEQVRISIHDKGPGIAAAFRERVFQKFAQADSSDTRQQGGTGLGLAISKELIEYMDGQIGFDSQPGQGACFWIELPRAAEGAPQ